MSLLFRVTNPGRSALTLPLLGREPSADFRIADAHGRPVWSRLRGAVMLGSLRLYQLAAGQSLSFRHAWDQRDDQRRPVPPGEYQVTGVLLTDAPGGIASAPVRLHLEP